MLISLQYSGLLFAETSGTIYVCSTWEKVLMKSFRFLKYFAGCIEFPVGSMGDPCLRKSFDHSMKKERLLGNLNGICDKTIEREYVIDEKPEQQLTPNVRFTFHRSD